MKSETMEWKTLIWIYFLQTSVIQANMVRNWSKNGAICTNASANIVFALDTSFSIHESSFRQQLAFVQRIISHFSIGKQEVRVAVLTFGSDVIHDIEFDDFDDKTALIAAVGNIRYRGGSTNTSAAIKHAREVILSEKNVRENSAQINIIITDGNSVDNHATVIEASISRSLGIKLVAVGVGAGPDRRELQDIASDRRALVDRTGMYDTDSLDSKLVFTVEDFSLLSDIEEMLSTVTCKEIQLDHLSNNTEYEKEAATQSCTGKAADVMFLVDASSSISSPNFRRMLEFTDTVMAFFDTRSSGTRIGLTSYSDDVNVVIPLNNAYSSQNMEARIAATPQLTGGTNTGRALQFVRGIFKTHSRLYVDRVVIVLTDGQSADPELTKQESRALKDMGVRMVVIGIGDQVDTVELLTMAGEDNIQSVLTLDNFHALPDISSTIAVKVCGHVDTKLPKYINDQEKSRCGGTLPTDVMYVYDGHSVGTEANSKTISTISAMIKATSNSVYNVRSGILNHVCEHVKSLDLSAHISASDMKNIITYSQSKNIPRLLQELRVDSFQRARGARRNSNKIAVIFIFNQTGDYTETFLELRRLSLQGQVKTFLVYVGNTIPVELKLHLEKANWNHTHFMQINELTDLKRFVPKFTQELCNN
ncbi:collagen alpha-6(VI) chain-like [Mya arenaria]|uniref:collagen alpha-6(VI) chain-like n=1 Tax=Mya arenaria TaxID=6604 RepID=UPI0022E2CC65|nr:collagen alpha-6(VI) chain-like [Mya arenaria]